jgi:hypothetical protein
MPQDRKAQAQEVQYAFRRLAALRKLGMHTAMWGPLRKIAERCGEVYPNEPEIVHALLIRLVLTDPGTPASCALGMLLDYYQPGWRATLPPKILGLVLVREDAEVTTWKKAVLRRDKRTCQECGAKIRLHVHHVMPWAVAPELRIVVANGLTLCEDCHAGRHGQSSAFVRSACRGTP